MFDLALVLAALTAPMPASSVSLQDQITAVVAKQVQQSHTTGAAVGVVRDGKLVYVKGFGLRNVATQLPVDAQTQFEIGSVTKQFTAAAILQLKEQGKLRLDESLAKFLPSFPHAKELTLRELLCQVSGLADYVTMKHFQHKLSWQTKGGIDKVADFARQPLHFRPGTRWEYSNTNYYLLGHVVEMVSGQSYEDYVRNHLFAPAGMAHSTFVRDESKLNDFATGYWRGIDAQGHMAGPKRPAPPIRESWAGGAGAIVSTVGDLAVWDSALAHGNIVNPSDFAMMSSPCTLKDGSKTAYGMGLGISELYGHKRIWHNGGTNGSLTMNATYPQDHVDVIVFENDLGGDPEAMESAVFGALFPDVVAAARRPAAGENLALRPRILRAIDETLHGTMPASEISPEFAKVATPQMQKQIAQQLEPLGVPTAVIYQGKGDHPNATRYTYRVEFKSRAMTFVIVIDKKTNLIDGLGLGPAP